MAETFNLVVPEIAAPEEHIFHAALIAGLSRVALKIGRGNLADKSKRTTRALDKLFSGSTSAKHYKSLADFLLADPTALDEVLALYGFQLAPLGSCEAIDFEIIADAADLHAEHTNAMRDGIRNHRETCRIADKARPVVQKYAAIIAEADYLKGAGR